MTSSDFKQIFNHLAQQYGFEHAYGGWFRVGEETIRVIDLQKSNYGDYFQMNIKVFIQGLFGKKYTKGKDLVKKEIGAIQNGPPTRYKELFDFDLTVTDENRLRLLNELFQYFIVPFSESVCSRNNIRKLHDEGKLHLLPAVKAALESLD